MFGFGLTLLTKLKCKHRNARRRRARQLAAEGMRAHTRMRTEHLPPAAAVETNEMNENTEIHMRAHETSRRENTKYTKINRRR